MATPKHKTSKSRTSSRKASNMRLKTPNLFKCDNCGNLILPHRVCPTCGFYKGQQVIDTTK